MVKLSTKLIILSGIVLFGLSILAIASNLTEQVPDSVLLGIAGAVIVIAIVSSLSILRLKHRGVKLIILGITMIMLGANAWLYGWDINNALLSWIGIAGVIVGVMVWLLGDDMSGAFDERVARLIEPVKGDRYAKK